MDFTGSIFSNKPKVQIPEESEVIWVNDMFVEDYVGGAELTSEALIQSSPFEVFKLHSKDVSMELLQQGHTKYWIFSNFTGMDSQLIPSVVANLKYSMVEYDYKFCRYRSPGKHEEAEQQPCGCDNEMYGKMVSALFHQARSLWWMAEKQQQLYHKRFPFLAENKNTVLSSVFSPETLGLITALREKYKDHDRKGWIVLDSPSWIKGAQEAKDHCEKEGLDYEVVWGVDYNTLLEKLAQAKGFVYLPKAGDTCPRLCIEAILLGCELICNENVQNVDEEWFHGVDILFKTGVCNV